MRRLLLLSILVLAPFVPQGARGAGLSLRWDNCYSDGGVANKTFACDTNTGSERLVMSFVLDNPLENMSGTEIRIAIASASPTLPNWWQFRNAGTCRLSSLSLIFTPPTGSANCTDWANGFESGGIGAYQTFGVGALDSATVTMAVAVPPTNLATIDPGVEYLAGSLVINHAKTVGSTACAGCSQPVCIALESMNLTTPVLANNLFISEPAFGAGGNFARWQDAQETNVQLACSVMSGCHYHFICAAAATPTRASTWGALKSLYR